MIHDRRAIRLDFDAAADVAMVVTAEGDSGGAPGVLAPRTLTLLLDKGGHLVGVDARDSQGRGVVIMLGPDSAVESTREVEARAAVDAAGAVTRVEVKGARKAIRADAPNPYLR
jgi:hypothetical protein